MITSAPKRIDGSPHHLGLLLAASELRQVAASGDREALHRRLDRLADDLVEHLAVEGPAIDALGPGDTRRRIVRDGQGRLRRLVDEARENVDGERIGGGECVCPVRTAQISVALARQAALERALFTTGARAALRTGVAR